MLDLFLWAETSCDARCPSTSPVSASFTNSLHVEGKSSFDSNIAEDNGGKGGCAQV